MSAPVCKGSCLLVEAVVVPGKVGVAGRGFARQGEMLKSAIFCRAFKPRNLGAGQGLREKVKPCQTNGRRLGEDSLIDNKANHVNGRSGMIKREILRLREQ